MTKLSDTQKFQEYCLITFMARSGWRYSPIKHIFRKGGEDPISYNRAVKMYNKCADDNLKGCLKVYIKYSKRKHKVVCERHKLQFINGYTLEDVELV